MPRSLLPALSLCVVAAVALVALTRTGKAADEPYGLRFIALSGEGSATKAWFDGAPPTGTRVQEALDRFAKEGYRFAGIQSSYRQNQVQANVFTDKDASTPLLSSTPEPTFVLILERVSR
jgi:hypothetical protein